MKIVKICIQIIGLAGREEGRYDGKNLWRYVVAEDSERKGRVENVSGLFRYLAVERNVYYDNCDYMIIALITPFMIITYCIRMY